MQRVTGLSVVGNQYVFVRGLGERYSNTTLGGAVIPTTEPDKKVVPLDLFPTALVNSVQVAKTYSPDKSAEFAGGLVQIIPLKFPSRPMLDVGYGLEFYSTATGKSILESPINGRDWLGYDNGARALPASFPDNKIVRRGIFTPDVGYYAGRDHGLRPRPRQPVAAGGKGRPGRARTGRRPTGTASAASASSPARGTPTRRASSTRPGGSIARRKPASSKPSATTTSRPASPARSSASSATWPTSSHPRTGCRSRTSTRTRAATRAASSRATTPRTCSSTRTTGCSSSRRACCRTASPASTSSPASATAASTGG